MPRRVRTHSRARMALVTVAAISLGAPLTLTAQQPDTIRKTVAADNTGRNKDHQVTAQSQSNTKSDIAITKAVRRAVTRDTALSTYAHNVKVITVGGQVTLMGPVRSTAEKSAIEAKAKATTGVVAVVNHLTIKPE